VSSNEEHPALLCGKCAKQSQGGALSLGQPLQEPASVVFCSLRTTGLWSRWRSLRSNCQETPHTARAVTAWCGVGCREAKQGLLEGVAPGGSPKTLSSRIPDTSIRLQLMSPFNGVQASCRVMVLTVMHVLVVVCGCRGTRPPFATRTILRNPLTRHLLPSAPPLPSASRFEGGRRLDLANALDASLQPAGELAG